MFKSLYFPGAAKASERMAAKNSEVKRESMGAPFEEGRVAYQERQISRVEYGE